MPGVSGLESFKRFFDTKGTILTGSDPSVKDFQFLPDPWPVPPSELNPATPHLMLLSDIKFSLLSATETHTKARLVFSCVFDHRPNWVTGNEKKRPIIKLVIADATNTPIINEIVLGPYDFDSLGQHAPITCEVDFDSALWNLVEHAQIFCGGDVCASSDQHGCDD